MGSGLAQTYDPKTSKKIGGINGGLQGNNSAGSIGLSNYTVPSMDGRLLPAIPIKLALKYKPPTIAVVYTMKDHKSGKLKKYIHEIRINFEPNQTVESVCETIVVKEATYLNPTFIAK